MSAHEILRSLPEEKTFYTRLNHLITDVGTKVLKVVLLKEIPVDKLAIKFQEKKQKLKRRLDKNQQEKEKVFPTDPHETTNPEKYDVSLLAFLVPICCNSLDKDKLKSVETIRTNRNEVVSHRSRAWISKEDYPTAWKSVTGAILNLWSLVQSEYPDIKDDIKEIEKSTVNTSRKRRSDALAAAAGTRTIDNLPEDPKLWVQQRFRALKEELHFWPLLDYIGLDSSSLIGFSPVEKGRRKNVAAVVAYLLTQSQDTLGTFFQYLTEQNVSRHLPSTPDYPGNIQNIPDVRTDVSEDLIKNNETFITQTLPDAEELADYQLEADILRANKYIELLQLPCSREKADWLLKVIRKSLPLSFRLFFYSLKQERQEVLVTKLEHVFRA